MKNFGVTLFFILVVFVLLFGFLGRDTKEDEIKIGVSVYKKEDTFISSITNEIEKLSKEKESNGINMRLDISDGRDNQLEQNDEIERYLSLDYDVIGVNLVDRTNASLIVDRAEDKNIPVVFFNREPVKEDLYRNSKIYYVGSKPKLSAIIQGELIVEAYNNHPELIDKNNDGVINYGMLEGEVGHQDSIYRTEYSIKTINAYGVNVNKVVSGVGNFDRNQGMALVEEWIEDDIDIELIISNNDDMALGALDAYKKNNMTMPIIGIDGTEEAVEEVKNGGLLGTVISDSTIYGEKLFDLMFALATSSPIPDGLDIENGKYIWIPWEGMLNSMYK